MATRAIDKGMPIEQVQKVLEQTETETKRRGKSTGDKLSPVENDSARREEKIDGCG